MRQDDAVRFTLQCLEDVRTRGLSSKSGPSCVDAAATWARVADPSEPIIASSFTPRPRPHALLTSLGMNEPPSLQSLDPSQRETVRFCPAFKIAEATQVPFGRPTPPQVPKFA